MLIWISSNLGLTNSREVSRRLSLGCEIEIRCSFEGEFLMNSETSATYHPQWMGEFSSSPFCGTLNGSVQQHVPTGPPGLGMLFINCPWCEFTLWILRNISSPLVGWCIRKQFSGLQVSMKHLKGNWFFFSFVYVQWCISFQVRWAVAVSLLELLHVMWYFRAKRSCWVFWLLDSCCFWLLTLLYSPALHPPSFCGSIFLKLYFLQRVLRLLFT